MQTYHWTGYSAHQRTQGITEAEDIVNCFGFLVDFHMYSDISISMNIEVQASRMQEMYDALHEFMEMSSKEDFSSAEGNCTVLLSINFAGGTGNLRNEVPEVPG